MPSLTSVRTDWLTGQIAGGGDRDDHLAGLLEEMQLAKRGDVVDARIGAGVGDHHQTFADKDAHAIGHFQPLGSPDMSADSCYEFPAGCHRRHGWLTPPLSAAERARVGASMIETRTDSVSPPPPKMAPRTGAAPR